MSNVKMPVSALEIQEYLFAANLPGATEESVKAARECFYFHRFQVMNWLVMNGVSIPVELMADQTHEKVGKQFVDYPNSTLRQSMKIAVEGPDNS